MSYEQQQQGRKQLPSECECGREVKSKKVWEKKKEASDRQNTDVSLPCRPMRDIPPSPHWAPPRHPACILFCCVASPPNSKPSTDRTCLDRQLRAPISPLVISRTLDRKGGRCGCGARRTGGGGRQKTMVDLCFQGRVRAGHNYALQLNMTPGPGSRTPISALPRSALSGQDKLLEISVAQVASVRSRPSFFFSVADFQPLGRPATRWLCCHWANGPIYAHIVFPCRRSSHMWKLKRR